MVFEFCPLARRGTRFAMKPHPLILLYLLYILISAQVALSKRSCYSFCSCRFSPIKLPGSAFQRSYIGSTVVASAAIISFVSGPSTSPLPRPGIAALPQPPPGNSNCIPCFPVRTSAQMTKRPPCCPSCPRTNGTVVYRAIVRKVYKGSVERNILVSTAADTRAGCGVPLARGRFFLLMGSKQSNGSVSVSRCSETKDFSMVSRGELAFLETCSGSNPVPACTSTGLF